MGHWETLLCVGGGTGTNHAVGGRHAFATGFTLWAEFRNYAQKF